MSINFPSSPTLNQQYTYGGRTWYWNGAVWKSLGTVVGAQGIQGVAGALGAQGAQGPVRQATFSVTPPVSPALNDTWIDANSGSEYTWTFDGNTYQWVELSASGFLGAQGTAGAPGAQGTQGIAGAAAAQGFQGATGAQGFLGTQGSVGPQGIQGTAGIGAQGAQGTTGVGVQGTQGIQGPSIPVTLSTTPPLNPNSNDVWVDSNSGSEYTYLFDGNSYQWVELSASGFSGVQGPAGALGTQGVQGIAGQTAAQGLTGFQGAQGFIGVQGSQGITGTGAQGTQGLLGVQGNAGAQGVQGNQGVQGPNAAITFDIFPPVSPNLGDRWTDSNTGVGYTWVYDGNTYQWVELSASGFSGLQGPQGPQGVQGTVGGTGIQGPAGAGYAQAQGTQGIQGIWGLQGIQGNDGTQGPSGAGYAQSQGVQGPLGPQGTAGPQGPTGIQGPIGFGAQGPNGPQGIQGAQGPVISALSSTTVTGLLEVANISASAASGIVNLYTTTSSVLYYTTAATANFTLNVAASPTVQLNSLMQPGQSMTVIFMNTNGATAYYNNIFTIDGTAYTPKWQGGAAPAAGNVNSVDMYTYVIFKNPAGNLSVFGSTTRFA